MFGLGGPDRTVLSWRDVRLSPVSDVAQALVSCLLRARLGSWTSFSFFPISTNYGEGEDYRAQRFNTARPASVPS
jgi:hypothetical protein